jgi:adenylosuccinate lyase
MPDFKWQRAEISRSYVSRIIVYAQRKGISRQEAELLVRRDMETEFEEIGQMLLQQRLPNEERVAQK